MRPPRICLLLAFVFTPLDVGTSLGQATVQPPQIDLREWGILRKRLSRNDFRRYISTVPPLFHRHSLDQQSALRQDLTRRHALRQQEDLRRTLRRSEVPRTLPTAERSATRAIPTTPRQKVESENADVAQPPPPKIDIDPNVILVWHFLGVMVKPEDADAVQSVTDAFSAGMRIVAVRPDGPAEASVWRPGDVIVGLYQYRIEQQQDLAYVANLPNLEKLSPLRAILLRDGKVVNSVLTPAKAVKPPTEAKSSNAELSSDDS